MLCRERAWSESGTSQEASPFSIGISLWHQTDWVDTPVFLRVWAKAGYKLQFQVLQNSPFSCDQVVMTPPDVIFSEFLERNDFLFDNTCWALFQLEQVILPVSLTLTSQTIGFDQATFNSFISETGADPQAPHCIFRDLRSSIINEVRTGSYKEENALITGKDKFA